ncbi:MAG: O-antigen ligase family protein [Flavobacteriales bacterium]
MKDRLPIIGGSLAFLIGHLVLVSYDLYWLALLPLICFVVLGSFFKPEWVLFIIVISTPLSLNLEKLTLGMGISLPTEPLIFGLMLLFLYKVILEGFPDPRILRHPMSILLAAYLLWTFITTLTSTLFLVSLKHFVAQFWFVTTFYFLPLYFFRERNWMFRFPWAYILPLVVVVVYTLVRHSLTGFQEDPAHFVMTPFYKDHTSYGAALALVTPVILERLFSKKVTTLQRIGLIALTLLFSVAIVFSYTRATWVSLVGGLFIYTMMLLKVRFKYILLGILIGLGTFFYYQDQIMMRLQLNRQESSNSLQEHLHSISNVATDASNLERLNRWKSAWKMFKDRPVFGFGPGTYQFKYAPYQNPADKTVISTNFGIRGTAHSEYLGPLSESGALGFLIRSGIVIYLFFMGFRLFRQLPKGRLRGLTIALFIGLTTYFTHGVLNNFLTRDKAAVPVWGFIAIMVAVDLYHKEAERKKAIEEGGASSRLKSE